MRPERTTLLASTLVTTSPYEQRGRPEKQNCERSELFCSKTLVDGRGVGGTVEYTGDKSPTNGGNGGGVVQRVQAESTDLLASTLVTTSPCQQRKRPEQKICERSVLYCSEFVVAGRGGGRTVGSCLQLISANGDERCPQTTRIMPHPLAGGSPPGVPIRILELVSPTATSHHPKAWPS